MNSKWERILESAVEWVYHIFDGDLGKIELYINFEIWEKDCL